MDGVTDHYEPHKILSFFTIAHLRMINSITNLKTSLDNKGY